MLDKIRAAAGLLVEHFPLLGGIALIWAIPVSLVELLLVQQAATFEERALYWPMYCLLYFGLGSLCFGALLQAQGRLCLGEAITIPRAFRDASETWDKLVAALLIAAFFVAVGGVFLIIPGLYLLVKYQFIGHVVALEGLDGRPARQRSWHLTHGVGWQTLCVYLLFMVPLAGLRFALPALAGTAYTESLFSQFMVMIASAVVMVVPFTAAFLYFWEQHRQEENLERLPQALLRLEKDYRQPTRAGL